VSDKKKKKFFIPSGYLPDIPLMPSIPESRLPSLPSIPSFGEIPIVTSPHLKEGEVLIAAPGTSTFAGTFTVGKSKADDLEKLAEIIGYKGPTDDPDEEDDELDLECGLFDEIELPEEPVEKTPTIEPTTYCILTDIESGKHAMFQRFDFQRSGRIDSPHVEFDLALRVTDKDLEEMGGFFRPGNRFHFSTSDDSTSMPLIITDVRHQYHEVGRESRIHLKGSVLDRGGPPETPSFWKGVL
jgi:hypothetical protein